MIIAVTNLKGGVGKSSICQALASYFVAKKVKVCIVDTDGEQQTSMRWSGIRDDDRPSIPVFGISDEKALSSNIKALEKDYQIVLIDGTPVLGSLATRTVLVSDLLLIPMLPSGADIWSLENFIGRVEEAASVLGKEIPTYVVINKFNSTGKRKVGLDSEVEKALTEDFGLKVLDTKINYRVAYREAMIEGLTAYEYKDPKARKEIESLGKEVTQIIKKMD